MSTTKHTAEPWHESGCSFRDICDDKDQVIGETCPTIDGDPHETMLANRARIVACVNACAGMEDPAKALELAHQRAAFLMGDIAGSSKDTITAGDLSAWYATASEIFHALGG